MSIYQLLPIYLNEDEPVLGIKLLTNCNTKIKITQK